MTFAEALVYACAYAEGIKSGQPSPAAIAMAAVEQLRKDAGTSRHFNGDVNRRAAEMLGDFREFDPRGDRDGK